MKYQISNILKKIGLLALIVLIAGGCIKKATDDSVNVPEHVQQPGSTSNTPPAAVSSTVTYKGVDGKNALELLKAGHAIETKTFSGVGEFVESIDGVKPDSKHFWSFYVNGKSSNVGASSYITKSGDTIEWRLEEIK